MSQIRQKETVKDVKRRLKKDIKRVAELDNIIKKLYESFAVGRISEERFDILIKEYEAKQKTLQASVSEAENQLEVFEKDTANVEQFLELAKKYTDFTELTTVIINEFIEKIIVHAPEKVDGDRVQEVEIYLNFIGRFELPPPELAAEEIKRQKMLRRQRIRSRERYQLIKAGEHKVGEPFKLTCKCYGNIFESKSSAAMFCNPNCLSKYYLCEKAEERRRDVICPICGNTFSTTRTDAKYCCGNCREKAARKRSEEKRKQKIA